MTMSYPFEKLPEKSNCTGCMACAAGCHTGAIEPRESNEGHIYPYVDSEKCMKCGKCLKVCPVVNPVDRNAPVEYVKACWIKDVQRRKVSSSGGLSYLLSKTVIEQGGYFCGVIMENNQARYKITNSLDSLHLYQGSKYTHALAAEVYPEIRKLLKSGAKVLFSGLPCQVAGLYSYLGGRHKSLMTIDILCHGVPSLKALRERISYVQDETGKRVVNVRFRDKNPDQYHSCMKYEFDDGSYLRIPVQKDSYFRAFVTNHILRRNCFSCQYANLQRVGDITLSDFWGFMPNRIWQRSYRIGTSMMMVNSEKGANLVKNLESLLIQDSRPVGEAVRGNRNLSLPQEMPDTYDEFWERYGAGAAIEKLMPFYYAEDALVPNLSLWMRFKMNVVLMLKTLGLYWK